MDPHHPPHHATHTNFMNPCHTRQNFDPHHPRLLFDPCQIFMDPLYPRQNFTDPCYPRHPHQSLTHATHEPTSPTHPSYPLHPRYLADSYCNGSADLQYRVKKKVLRAVIDVLTILKRDAKWTQTSMRFHFGWKSQFDVQSALYLCSHELRWNETQNGMDFVSVILTGKRFSREQNLPEIKWISEDTLDVAFNAQLRLKLIAGLIGLFWNAAEMKLHVNRTCFYAGLKSHISIPTFHMQGPEN